MAKMLSGPQWVQKFPNSTNVEDLTDPFRGNVKNFLAALKKAGARVSVTATLRPKERAWLMHWSFEVAAGLDPDKVDAMQGVDIDWVHRDADLAASKFAAEKMVTGYDIAFEPAINSLHSEGRAIDIDVSWTTAVLTINDPSGKNVAIATSPRSGGNTDLHKIGASYGVFKLVQDPPHWSSTGH